MLNHEILEKIVKNSVSLERHGINGFAWNPEDAKKVINLIIDDGIGILGGDVYKLTSSRLEVLCDNWACEPFEGEPVDEYYLRSKLESLRYIERYPINPGECILFSMTFSEDIC